jgi:hypothetical protein
MKNAIVVLAVCFILAAYLVEDTTAVGADVAAEPKNVQIIDFNLDAELVSINSLVN